MPTIKVQAIGEKPTGRPVVRDLASILPDIRKFRAEAASETRWNSRTPEARMEFQRRLNVLLLIVAEAAVIHLTDRRR